VSFAVPLRSIFDKTDASWKLRQVVSECRIEEVISSSRRAPPIPYHPCAPGDYMRIRTVYGPLTRYTVYIECQSSLPRCHVSLPHNLSTQELRLNRLSASTPHCIPIHEPRRRITHQCPIAAPVVCALHILRTCVTEQIELAGGWISSENRLCTLRSGSSLPSG
jgi:hypothetical protein